MTTTSTSNQCEQKAFHICDLNQQNEVRDPSTTDQKKYASKDVLQNEAGITNARSSHPIIGSFGAFPCVILSMYNPRIQTAALAHIDAVTNLQQGVQMLVDQMQVIDSDLISIELATGCLPEINPTLQKLKDTCAKVKNFCLKKIHHSEVLSIDARSGDTFYRNELGFELASDERKQIRKSQEELLKGLPLEERLPLILGFDDRA